MLHIHTYIRMIRPSGAVNQVVNNATAAVTSSSIQESGDNTWQESQNPENQQTIARVVAARPTAWHFLNLRAA
jgi:hypothetical protein